MKMFKLTRMLYRGFCNSNSRRNDKKILSIKAKLAIRRINEDREEFGPVLKKRKDEKNNQKQFNPDTQTSLEINSNESNSTVIPSKINFDLYNESEFNWLMKSSKFKSLKRIINDSNSSKETDVSKLLEKKSEPVLTNRIINSTVNDIDINSDKKRKLNDIILSIKNASMFHTPKDDADKWDSSSTLSLSNVDEEYYSLPGVTSILNASMTNAAKLALERWKQNMIFQLGEEGFQIYQKKLLDDSTIMHSFIQKILKKEPYDVPDNLQPTYKSIKNVLDDMENVRFTESHVVHPTLGYRGIIDCVGTYKGKLCVIDWKKSDKLKTLESTYDSPLQLSAYVGALNNDEKYPFKVDSALLVFAYTNGEISSVFELSTPTLELYWKKWLRRLEKYYVMRNPGVQ